ncbi:A/G-specific adenine glycosylase [Candidatus Marinamargulisbacteria bacterium SCGC AG-410-N11]|nr:A/G-specific adenine glycosylase [Candidatus Marinamargulisbacteria bacterium SCGC AG-410-N11]
MNWTFNLLDWFSKQQRPMPWRQNPSAYGTWISEMMLQQTQVVTVIPYFERFMTQFPTIQSLADAPLEKVLKAWEGLGYYSRARNLHKAAKIIVNDFNGTVPNNYKTLLTLPGIGPYIAAAIGSIAFEEPVPVVDGNVLRVFTRYWGIFDDIMKMTTRTMLTDRLTPYIQDVKPSDFNQAIMELGALICKPKDPLCSTCPLQEKCFAFHSQKIAELPYKPKKAAVPHHTIVVGVIWKDDKVLITKRKEDQMLGGLWEFPGGKLEKGESLKQALIREVNEEVDIQIKVGAVYGVIKHAYSHFKITLHAYHCEYVSGTPIAKSASDLKWVSPKTLHDLPFPKANKSLIPLIINS